MDRSFLGIPYIPYPAVWTPVNLWGGVGSLLESILCRLLNVVFSPHMFPDTVGSFIYLLNIKLLLCARHCMGAGDSKISKNRHDPHIYRIHIEFMRDLSQMILQMKSHSCDQLWCWWPVGEGSLRQGCLSQGPQVAGGWAEGKACMRKAFGAERSWTRQQNLPFANKSRISWDLVDPVSDSEL